MVSAKENFVIKLSALVNQLMLFFVELISLSGHNRREMIAL
jgi:hypothetical protein